MYIDNRKIVTIEYSLQHYKYVLSNIYNNMLDRRTFDTIKEAEEYAALAAGKAEESSGEATTTE